VSKVNLLMSQAIQHSLQDFYNPLLDIMYELLLCAAAFHPSAQGRGEDEDEDLRRLTEPLVSNVDLLIGILATTETEAHDDVAAWKGRERAAKCVYAVCRVYPQFHNLVVTPHNLHRLSQCLAFLGGDARGETDDVVGNLIYGTHLAALKTMLVLVKASTKVAALLGQPAHKDLLRAVVDIARRGGGHGVKGGSSVTASSAVSVEALAKEVHRVIAHACRR
jgi:hypothetical protein